MAAGNLALVLHAHLPYVHSNEPGSLEEDWYFQALLECYLPLLDVLEQAAADPQQAPRLSMGLSPTLLSLLSNAGERTVRAARFLRSPQTRTPHVRRAFPAV